MKTPAPTGRKAARSPERSATVRRGGISGLGTGHTAKLAALANDSPRVQAQLKLSTEIHSSQQVATQRGLASQINAPSPAVQFANTSSSQESSAVGGAAPVVQRLGANVEMVDEDDRFFETRTGKTRLRVNPDADAYLEGHFEKDSAASLTNASLGEKFSHAMNRVHKGIPYNRAGKVEAFDSHRQPTEEGGARRERSLGYMLHTESATCWEKAAHFHLVLAELGITTFLEGGTGKSSGEGHAWLVIPASEQAFGGKQVVIDPTNGEISARATYESQYDINVPAKQVARPKVGQSPKDVEKALKEFAKLEELGGLVKKSVLDIIDLKIERAMNEKRREKEKAEWDKILLKFNESFK
jgi:hypothetical protein